MVSVIGLWAHQTVFDTDAFMETIEPVLQDPALNAALGDYITEEVTGALDLEERLQEPLANLDAFLSAALLGLLGIGEEGQEFLEGLDRPTLQALAGPIADRFNERIANRVDQVMASPEVTELIPRLVRRGHEAAVALARDDLEGAKGRAFTDLALVLALIPDLGRWSDKEKRDVRRIIRAKTGKDESLYAKLLQKHARLRGWMIRQGSGVGGQMFVRLTPDSRLPTPRLHGGASRG